MKAFLSAGTITGLLALLAAAAAAAGFNNLVPILNDTTTINAFVAIAGVLAQIAGALEGANK